MAATSLLTLSSLLLLVLLLSPPTQAQGPAAPSPAPSGPFNVTALLEKGGQFTMLIKLLDSTQADNQIVNQLNNSKDGMTLFAPTDNAFNNLKSGALNSLNPQQQVQLIQYHILPKFYKLTDLPLVSNPVRTQASGQDGKPFNLNFMTQGNQVNVSTGVVETQINNALSQQMPMAVYQVDKVLLPNELFGAKSSSPSAAPTTKTSPEGSTPTLSDAKEPASEDSANAGGRINAGFGIVGGLALLCMGVLS